MHTYQTYHALTISQYFLGYFSFAVQSRCRCCSGSLSPREGSQPHSLDRETFPNSLETYGDMEKASGQVQSVPQEGAQEGRENSM